MCVDNIEMSAIQASILSPTNNERRGQARISATDQGRGGGARRGEMVPEVAANAAAAATSVGGYSTQMRRNSIDSSLSKVILIFLPHTQEQCSAVQCSAAGRKNV